MKKNKGITLIALVITIIVLLILAGVTINAIVGNESAMEKAKEAKIEDEKGNELDTIKLAVTDAIVKETDGTIHLDKLNESLAGLVKREATGDSPWIVTGNKGYKYRITSYGEVTLESTVDIVKNNQIVTGEKIKIDKTEIGHTVQLTFETTSDIIVTSSSWSSSNTSAATIDNTGLVTIVAEGNTTITLTVVTSIGNITKTCTIKVGDFVNYITSLNGVTLDDWKVFYVDGDYTYIIYGDYLPNSAINISDIDTNPDIDIKKEGDYVINGSYLYRVDQADCWKSLLKGTLNGNEIDYRNSTDINIKTLSTPTLQLFISSWNTKYPDNSIYTKKDKTYGYYVGTTEEPTTGTANVMNTVGYQDVLYFPYKNNYEGCTGYWLIGDYRGGPYWRFCINCNGRLTDEGIGYGKNCFRPVICLPSSILQ